MRSTVAFPHGALGRAAKRLGVHRGHLSKVLHGRGSASPELAVRILCDPELQLTGLSLCDLLGIELPAHIRIWSWESDADVRSRVERRSEPTTMPDARQAALPFAGEAA